MSMINDMLTRPAVSFTLLQGMIRDLADTISGGEYLSVVPLDLSNRTARLVHSGVLPSGETNPQPVTDWLDFDQLAIVIESMGRMGTIVREHAWHRKNALARRANDRKLEQAAHRISKGKTKAAIRAELDAFAARGRRRLNDMSKQECIDHRGALIGFKPGSFKTWKAIQDAEKRAKASGAWEESEALIVRSNGKVARS
jgi:hypothetical protein